MACLCYACDVVWTGGWIGGTVIKPFWGYLQLSLSNMPETKVLRLGAGGPSPHHHHTFEFATCKWEWVSTQKGLYQDILEMWYGYTHRQWTHIGLSAQVCTYTIYLEINVHNLILIFIKHIDHDTLQSRPTNPSHRYLNRDDWYALYLTPEDIQGMQNWHPTATHQQAAYEIF